MSNIYDDEARYDRLEVMITALTAKMEAQLKDVDERLENLENRIAAVADIARRDTLALQAELFALSKRVDKLLASAGVQEPLT